MTRRAAFVTGGSRGIGRAAAEALARAGMQVVINFRENEAAAKATLDALPGDGHLALQADVADASAVEEAVDRVVRHCGRLDVLVNNAGTFEADRIDATSYDEWRAVWKRSLDVNLLGAANASHCAVKHMRNHGGGRIIHVGSRGAYRGDPEYLAYVAAKAGMKAMAQSMAIQLAKYDISVFTVAPGFVDTDMAAPFIARASREAVAAQSPMQRIATASEIADVIAFLATDAPAMMTGAVVDVNGASWLRP